MALTVTVSPGKTFAKNEKITIAKLNQLGQPTFSVTGTVGASEVTDASVTAVKTIAGPHFYASLVTFLTGDFTLTLPGTPAVADGMVIAFKASAAGVPDVTNGIRIKIGASTKKLFKNITDAIDPGDIVANQIVECRYDTAGDGGAGAWQMTSHLSTLPVYYSGTVGGTANAITVAVAPPSTYAFVLANLVGIPLRFIATNANTAAVTLAVTIGGTALAARTIVKNFNQNLAANDIKVGQVVEVAYDATNDKFQMLTHLGNPDNDSTPTGSAGQFTAQNNLAAADTKIDVSFTDLVMRDTNGVSVRVSGSTTVDIDVLSAANGRDYGGAEANVWHYLWMIGTDAGGGSITTAGLLSQSATAPTLPTGYTFKALMGAVYNNTNLQRFAQHGRNVWIVDTNIFTAKGAAVSDTWEILAGADLTAFRAAIPPTARTVSGSIGWSATGIGSKVGISGTKSDGSVDTTIAIGATYVTGDQNGAAWNGFTVSSQYSVPVRGGTANYNVQWKKDDNTNPQARLNVSGYTV